MSKQIKVTIDKVGRPTIEAIGFAGCGCTAATQPIVDALSDTNKRDTVEVEEKPEMAMIETEENHEQLYS